MNTQGKQCDSDLESKLTSSFQFQTSPFVIYLLSKSVHFLAYKLKSPPFCQAQRVMGVYEAQRRSSKPIVRLIHSWFQKYELVIQFPKAG